MTPVCLDSLKSNSELIIKHNEIIKIQSQIMQEKLITANRTIVQREAAYTNLTRQYELSLIENRRLKLKIDQLDSEALYNKLRIVDLEYQISTNNSEPKTDSIFKLPETPFTTPIAATSSTSQLSFSILPNASSISLETTPSTLPSFTTPPAFTEISSTSASSTAGSSDNAVKFSSISRSSVENTFSSTTLASSLFSHSSKWNCDICLASNKDTDVKCACCSSPKPGHKKAVETEKPTQLAPTTSLKSLLSAGSSKWTCNYCLVSNDVDKLACVCCQAPEPGAASANENNYSAFPIKFASPEIKFNFLNDSTVGTPSTSSTATSSTLTPSAAATTAKNSAPRIHSLFKISEKSLTSNDSMSNGGIPPANKFNLTSSNSFEQPAPRPSFTPNFGLIEFSGSSGVPSRIDLNAGRYRRARRAFR